jgi:RHS repeat-associated protein
LVVKVNKISIHNRFPLYHKSLPLYRRRPNRRKNISPGESGKISSKELDPETGFYYYGTRYLDPRTSRWLSGDPALGDYLPQMPVNDEAKKNNGNLPGQGGVFNLVNLHVYHYAGNNPVKYVDPNGRTAEDDLQNLKDYVGEANKQENPSEKASWARGLRNIIRDLDIDALMEIGEEFINDELRDFLNISDTGEDYIESDLQSSDQWSLHPGTEYHNDENFKDIRKYVNKDGREVVFGTSRDSGGREEVKGNQHKGTYNYAKNVYQWWDSSEHGI